MAQAYFSDSDNGLVMLGIIHRDRESARLLSTWLESAKPGVVTLEFSRYGLEFRKAKGDALKERLRKTIDDLTAGGQPVCGETVNSLLSYVDLPLEYTILSDYAAHHHVPFHLIDMDRFSYLKLREIEVLLSKENLSCLLSDPIRTGPSYEKTLARLFFEKGVRVFPYTEEMHIRDRYMRDRIASLRKRSPASRLLHVCGWQHLSDPCSLYSELNPTKVFIYDKTLCI